jgi:hypothetical protein
LAEPVGQPKGAAGARADLKISIERVAREDRHEVIWLR